MITSTGFLKARKRGFILLTVLMVSTFLISASVGFAWFVRDQVHRVQMNRFELRARGVAYLAVLNVMRGLQLDKNGYDSLEERWFGNHLIPFGDSLFATLTLTPLDDKIPLNGLFLPDRVTLRGELSSPWSYVWDEVGLPELSAPTLDFMDRDSKGRVGGYERESFINRPLVDISELLLIPDIKQENLIGEKGLETYLTRWCGNKININTASAKVLATIDGIDDVTAQEIVDQRLKKPFKNMRDLASLFSFSGSLGPKISNALGTTSDFFLLELNVSVLGADYSKSYRIIMSKKNILKWEEV